MGNEVLFALENVSYAHGAKQAVDSLTLTIRPGRFHGLVGPNGCGKTTLLDLLIGNRQAKSGSVRYKGRPVAAYPKRELAREIALVPQDFSIHFAFTVHEVVLMGRHPYIPRFGGPSSHDLTVTDRAMTEIGISEFKERSVTSLSGGEKQRVVVARALAQQTPVLLLDEATSNLDIKYTLDIFRAVHRQVRESGRTAIAVIHNLNLAAAFCDQVVFMEKGRLHEAGPCDEVLTAENVRRVFGVKSRVFWDSFSRVRQIAYDYGLDHE